MKNILKRIILVTFVVSCLSVGFYSLIQTKTSAAEKTSEAADGAALYKKRCSTCHGNDGQAKNFRGKVMHATNLTNATWQDDVSDEHIFNVISSGKKDMPAFSKKLSSDEINSLVSYIRGLRK